MYCDFLQSKAVLVLLSLGKFYKALDMLYRYWWWNKWMFYFSFRKWLLSQWNDELLNPFPCLQHALLWPSRAVCRSLSGVWLSFANRGKEQYPFNTCLLKQYSFEVKLDSRQRCLESELNSLQFDRFDFMGNGCTFSVNKHSGFSCSLWEKRDGLLSPC